MFDYGKLTLGVVPSMCYFYPGNRKTDVLRRVKALSEKYEVKYVDIEHITENGMLETAKDIPQIVHYFREEDVDALFIPLVNFGSEEAVAKLCKQMGKPVLLWGPRDPAPKGILTNQGADRQFDTQCGLFSTGKALASYGVPFTYIENCEVDSEILENGFDRFIRVACGVRAFKNLRIGMIDVRPWQFISVRVNEQELLEKFGIEVVTLPNTMLFDAINQAIKENLDEISKIIDCWKRKFNLTQVPQDNLQKMAAVHIAMKQLANEHGFRAMAADCWYMLQKEYGINPCFNWGELIDQGLPVACENDILGAATAAIAQGVARYDTVPFMADLTIRHPENDNAELLWHCGPFPGSLIKERNKAKVFDCKGIWEIKGGDITVLRIGNADGKYFLFADEAHSVDGPPTNGTYIWIETENWPMWEKKFVCGPYIHHVIGIHGKYKQILQECTKYLGPIQPDSVIP